MKNRNFNQSEYMSLQLMEIENFRKALMYKSDEKITLQEAMVLWISGGYADEFKSRYFLNKNNSEPAKA